VSLASLLLLLPVRRNPSPAGGARGLDGVQGALLLVATQVVGVLFQSRRQQQPAHAYLGAGLGIRGVAGVVVVL